MAFVNEYVGQENIVGETISYETIHEFGLTELLNVYKQSKERYPNDYFPYVGVLEGEWVWGCRDYDWFKDKNNSNWIYAITGFRTYLLCCDGVLYEARVDKKNEGDIRGGV